MLQKAFAYIKYLSQETQYPQRTEQAMHAYLISNIKLTKRNLTLNVLNNMAYNKIGTNEVI